MGSASYRAGGAGATVWLTGLPAAGKSTLAFRVADELARIGIAAVVLDGDEMRQGLNSDLGFSAGDRAENVRRVGEVALHLASSGMVALVALVSPFRVDRDRVRGRHEAAGISFFEVHVATPISLCQARDPKGLYEGARQGEVTQLTGISDPYEAPRLPELAVFDDEMDQDTACMRVLGLLGHDMAGEGRAAPAPAPVKDALELRIQELEDKLRQAREEADEFRYAAEELIALRNTRLFRYAAPLRRRYRSFRRRMYGQDPSLDPDDPMVYGRFVAAYEDLGAADMAGMQRTMASWATSPAFSVLIIDDEISGSASGESALPRTLKSLLGQVYPHWTVRVLTGGSSAAEILGCTDDKRVQIERMKPGHSWSQSAVTWLRSAGDGWIVWLEPGDVLAVHALFLVARESLEHPDALMIYTDEDRYSTRTGSAQPGDAQPGDAQSGDAQSGDAQSGSAQSGSAQPGDGLSRYGPYFKPGWSPDLLLSHDYLGQLTAIRASAVRQVLPGSLIAREPAVVAASAGSEPYWGPEARYDLALRMGESGRTRKDASVSGQAREGDDASAGSFTGESVRHVAFVCCHRMGRRPKSGDSLPGGRVRPLAEDVAGVRAKLRDMAVYEHLARMGHDATVTPVRSFPAYREVSYAISNPPPTVAVVVLTRDGRVLEECVAGLLERTAYPRLHVYIVDNGSTSQATRKELDRYREYESVTVVRDDSPFNYSRLNNQAVALAGSDLICLLNDDVIALEPQWLTEMVGVMSQPDVGVVGAKLLYPDGALQHVGVALGLGRGSVAGHPYCRAPRTETGYHGRTILAQDVSAVTAACMLVRRELYEDLGGLDEEHLGVAFNDVDFCLRVRLAGYRVVWTPRACLTHHESLTRGEDQDGDDRFLRFSGEVAWFRARWGDLLDDDPFYNPNLSRFEPYRLAFPPRHAFPWRTEGTAGVPTGPETEGKILG